MALLDIRQRTGWLFLAVTVGHLILISTQVNNSRGIPLLEAATFGVFAELQRAASSAVNDVEDGWQNYFALQQIRRENLALREELARTQIRLQRERALAQQSRGLQELLNLRGELEVETTGARVIGGGASPEFRTMTIDKGQQDGVGKDMAVIAPAGVVGRIILPSTRASKVQLLIDRNAAAGALVERSRAQGVVMGMGTDTMRLDYVPESADIKVGDVIVTSGIDGIYPKGFTLGRIESIQRGGAPSGRIVVRPSVQFSSLEAVLVVVSGQPSEDGESPSTSGTTPGVATQPSTGERNGAR